MYVGIYAAEYHFNSMAAITTRNATQAVISADDLKEMLECPVMYLGI